MAFEGSGKGALCMLPGFGGLCSSSCVLGVTWRVTVGREAIVHLGPVW